MSNGNPWLYRLAACAGAMFIVTLLCSLVIPVYYDDIAVLIARSRSGYDDWHSITSQNVCLQSFKISIPLLIQPGRALSWIAHLLTPSLLMLRLQSVMIFGLWLALFDWLIRHVFLPSLPAAYSLVLAFSLSGIGMMPWAMVQGRPEPAIVTCIALFIALPFMVKHYPAFFTRYLWFICTGLWWLLSYFLSLHPKDIFYAPLALGACCYLPFATRTQRTAMLLICAAIAAQAWQYSASTLPCPESAGMEKFRAMQALRPDQLAHPIRFIELFSQNLLHFPRYIDSLLFQPMQTWTTRIEEPLWWLRPINLIISILAVGVVITALSTIVWCCVQNGVSRLWLRPADSMLGLLALALFAQSGLQNTKMFYEASLVWASLLLLAGLSLSYAPWPRWIARYWHKGLAVILSVAMLSQITLVTTYMPKTIALLRSAPKDGILMGGPHILSVLSSPAVNAHTLELAEKCGIKPDSDSRFLVVDSSTYLAMQYTKMPIYQPYYREPNYSDDFYRALSAMQIREPSSGLITSCRSLPSYLRGSATQAGGLCCLGKGQMIPAILLPEGHGSKSDTGNAAH